MSDQGVDQGDQGAIKGSEYLNFGYYRDDRFGAVYSSSTLTP